MPTTTINLTGQALSKTDDTNVTLTLGGTPATALLKATSFTLGWTGTLADARIASAATWNAKESALTFSTGLTRTVNTITIDSTVVTLTGAQDLSNKTGLISQWTNDSGYLTSLSGAVTSVTGSGNIASSGGATPNITFTGVLPTANGGTGVNIATTALTLGTASSAVGSIVLQNATNANTITIQSGVTTSSHTLTLPVANASGVLTNNGSGTLTWAAASSGITVGTTTITSGTTTRVPFNDAGVYGEDADFTWDKTNNTLTLGGTAGNMSIAQKLGTGGTGDVIKFYTSGNFYDMNIAIGYGRTYSGAAGVRNVQLGNGLYTAITGGYNTLIGDNSGLSISGNVNYNTALGYGAGANTNVNSTLCLGYSAIAIAANQCVIGAAAAAGGIGVYDNLYFNGVTSTTPASINIRASGGSGTNVAGANMTLYAGNATGTGASGNFKVTSSVKGSSGTTLQTSGDRVAVIGKYVDLTAATPTAFARINIPTSTTAGGFIIASVEANDGTDFQNRTFYVSWAAVNKAGTTTVTLDVPHEIVASTSGTLTVTMTVVDSGSGNIDFKMDAVSSLVETTLRASFQVFKNFGTGAISAS